MVAEGVRSLWTVDIRMKLIDQYTVLLHITYFDLRNCSRRHKFEWAGLVCSLNLKCPYKSAKGVNFRVKFNS